MSSRNDGRVTVIEKASGKEVRLYPVDAREAVGVGSHAYIKGKELPSSNSAEIDALRKRVAELEAAQAAKPGAPATDGASEPASTAPVAPPPPAPAAAPAKPKRESAGEFGARVGEKV